MTTLDVTDCAFECGNRATGVREYRRDARTTVWLGACDGCDERARIDLARAESKYNRQLTTPLADAVLDEVVHARQQQRGYVVARTSEDWERIRARGRERAAEKKRRQRTRRRAA